jgi:hypothetical protein
MVKLCPSDEARIMEKSDSEEEEEDDDDEDDEELG